MTGFDEPELRHRIKFDPANMAACVPSVVELIPPYWFFLNRRKHLGRTMRDGTRTMVRLSWMDLFLCCRFNFVGSTWNGTPPRNMARLVKNALEQRKRSAVER